MDPENESNPDTVTIEVPAETVATETLQATLEASAEAASTAEVAIGIADNATQVAASASDDVDELEESWQEQTAQLATALAGVQTTSIQQATLLQSLVELLNSNQAQMLSTLAELREFLTPLLLEMERAKAAELPPPSAVEAAPVEAPASPEEAKPQEPANPRPKRRVL